MCNSDHSFLPKCTRCVKILIRIFLFYCYLMHVAQAYIDERNDLQQSSLWALPPKGPVESLYKRDVPEVGWGFM